MDHTEKEFRRLLDRYIQGTITPDEQHLLDRFFDENVVKTDKEAVNPDQFVFLEKRVKEKIDFRILPKRSRNLMLFRVAAALAVLIVISYVGFFLKKNDPVPTESAVATLIRKTDRGQKITIRLPDGTVVKLNSTSTLEFPEKFAGNAREVVLKGEGFFDVVPDPALPFIVRTAHSSTRVLGTSFNIREKTAERTEVTLVTGKVRVFSENKEMSLRPNQQAVILAGEGQIDTASVDVNRFIEWKDNVLTFDNTPLTEVTARLEEWYGVDIQIKSKAIERCRITARYESESLENVLKSIAFMLKGEFSLRNKNVLLTGKGCNDNQ